MRQVPSVVMLLGCLHLSGANAQSKGETWNCKAYGGPVLVVAGHDGKSNGTIQVAGTTQKAFFAVSGFDRRWTFGEPIKAFATQYLFVIEPNGRGSYFDFAFANKDGLADARQVYVCELVEQPATPKPANAPSPVPRNSELKELPKFP